MPRAPRLRRPLLLALAVALLLPLGAAPAAAGSRARIAQEDWVAWQVADRLNDVRSTSLTGWTDLRDVAEGWADAIADRGGLEHNPSYADDTCCWQRAGEVLGELTISDDATADELSRLADRVVDAWLASSSHRSTILDGSFDQVGVGVTIDHAAGQVWVVADLRDVADGGSPPGSAWYRRGGAAPATPGAGWPCHDPNAPFGATSWPLADSTLVRRSGSDRVATALALSADRTAPRTVLIASSGTPSDALAAAGLAGTMDAPVLLTGASALDGRVASRLRSWHPDHVVLLGGTRALSTRLAQDVTRAVPSTDVQRIAGTDRFATAAAIASRVRARGGDTGRVLLALGSHPDPSRSWADAVTVSGLAASHHHPVLLTPPGSLPASTRDALVDLQPSEVLVAGGASGVSETVLAQVRSALPGAAVTRVAGADRYATSRAVVALDQAWRGTASRRIHVVDGGDWPDALTAGPAAAHDGAVVALVDGHASAAADAGRATLDLWSDQLRRLDVTLVGGDAAISPDRAGAVRDELHCMAS